MNKGKGWRQKLWTFPKESHVKALWMRCTTLLESGYISMFCRNCTWPCRLVPQHLLYPIHTFWTTWRSFLPPKSKPRAQLRGKKYRELPSSCTRCLSNPPQSEFSSSPLLFVCIMQYTITTIILTLEIILPHSASHLLPYLVEHMCSGELDNQDILIGMVVEGI